MGEPRQRMLGGRAGSAGGAERSRKHILPPKGKRPAEKYGKLLPPPLSELLKTKSLHLLFAACFPDAFRRAVSLASSLQHHVLSATALLIAMVDTLTGNGQLWKFSQLLRVSMGSCSRATN